MEKSSGLTQMMTFPKKVELKKGDGSWKPSTEKSLLKVCRKRWRTLDLAPGSPTPPMRINSACALFEGELYLFGGLNAGPSKSLWALSVRDRRWRPIPTTKGTPPAPRQGHTMCWDGATSLWVFGGQGRVATTNTDFSRTHQGIKIRTLAKRTCLNDYHEFNAITCEWRDHVQAGVCPTSRRGHTATLVIGRQRSEPKTAAAASPSSKLSTNNYESSFDSTHGSTTAGGGNSATSSPRRKRAVTGDGATNGACCQYKTSEQQHRWEGRSSRRGGFRGDEVTSHHGDVRGRSRGRSHGKALGGQRNETSEFASREMFLIGGAGTDPIKNIEVVHPQLWIFDFDLSSWTCVDAESGGSWAGPDPPAVFDHSATLVGKEHIVVVGGVMVGRALNSQVFTLALDTLQWSTLAPHPLGLTAPSIHGHTAVEDPTHAGRIIVFGGRGGTHWNTEVLIFNSKQRLWSMAVCEMAPRPPSSPEGRNPSNANNASTAVENHGKVASPLTVTFCEPAESTPSADGRSTSAGRRNEYAQMPHHRSGHTCFVWDATSVALSRGGTAAGVGRVSGSTSNKEPGASVSEETRQNRRGEANEQGINRLSSKRSRSEGGESKDTTASENKGGVPGERVDHAEGHVPHPCIITFGGSALRPGGGYSAAKLHILEDPLPEANTKVFEGNELDEEATMGRRKTRLDDGISGALGGTTRRQSINKFQTCTNSVFLKLHSLRQLGNRQPTINSKVDLSYIDSSVRSAILGESNQTHDESEDDISDKTTWHSPISFGEEGETVSPEEKRVGVFPTDYEQVKAFLANARPVGTNHRPTSVPTHAVGGDKGGVSTMTKQGRGRAGLIEKKRPDTVGVPLKGSRGNQPLRQSSTTLPPMTLSAKFATASVLTRQSSMHTSGASIANSSFIERRKAATASCTRIIDREASHVVLRSGGSSALFTGEGGNENGGGWAGGNSGADLFPRSASAGGAMRERLGRSGRPLLLPRPTLAAHNGRMLMDYEWAAAGYNTGVI